MSKQIDSSCEKSARRIAVRFEGASNFQAVDSSDHTQIPGFRVLDFNTQGCRLKAYEKLDKALDCDTVVELKFRIPDFHSDGSPWLGHAVAGRVVSSDSNLGELSVVFSRPLRLEQLGHFGPFFVSPRRKTHAERRVIYEQQEKLASSDIQELQQSTRENINRLFSLLTIGAPSIGGLLVAGILLNFEPEVFSGADVPSEFGIALAVLIPLFCAITSSVAFLIYAQKTARVRERVAFCMLLQRYIWMGAFPPCYRGWHDAQLNMRQFELRGSDKKVFRDPPPIKESLGISWQVPFTKDPFTAAGVFSFVLLTIVSIVVTGFGLWSAFDHVDSGSGIWKVAVALAVTLITLFFFVTVLYKEIRVQCGHKSTRHIILRYCELLKCVPPYDPLNSGKLRFTHKDA
jgi:hypothetical protein